MFRLSMDVSDRERAPCHRACKHRRRFAMRHLGCAVVLCLCTFTAGCREVRRPAEPSGRALGSTPMATAGVGALAPEPAPRQASAASAPAMGAPALRAQLDPDGDDTTPPSPMTDDQPRALRAGHFTRVG